MVLCQIVITYEDIAGYLTSIGLTPGGQASTFPIILSKNINLYGGPYIAKIAGVQTVSGDVNTTSYSVNPQLIRINSNKFVFPGLAQQGLLLSNVNASGDSSLAGHREFLINTISGNVDICIQIQQYGTIPGGGNSQNMTAPYVLLPNATWTFATFAHMIISLDIIPYHD